MLMIFFFELARIAKLMIELHEIHEWWWSNFMRWQDWMCWLVSPLCCEVFVDAFFKYMQEWEKKAQCWSHCRSSKIRNYSFPTEADNIRPDKSATKRTKGLLEKIAYRMFFPTFTHAFDLGSTIWHTAVRTGRNVWFCMCASLRFAGKFSTITMAAPRPVGRRKKNSRVYVACA